MDENQAVENLKNAALDYTKFIPCPNCKRYKDELNGFKSKEKSWREKYVFLETNIKEGILSKNLVKLLFGGSFPDYENVDFESISYWKIEGNFLIPYTVEDIEKSTGAPDFKIDLVPFSRQPDDTSSNGEE